MHSPGLAPTVEGAEGRNVKVTVQLGGSKNGRSGAKPREHTVTSSPLRYASNHSVKILKARYHY
ncbi:hypothetical protein AB0M11_30235 [Streptomyces sp. NPDC051987]|uniref:hypothetical protein n=1 Tax=Streptomyces sp. NPDC051987 TaxID=3155808 RepID=UPI00341F9E5B